MNETSDIAAHGPLRWGHEQRRVRGGGYPGERRNNSDPGGRPGQAHGAASQFKMMQAGEVTVKLEILSKGD